MILFTLIVLLITFCIFYNNNKNKQQNELYKIPGPLNLPIIGSLYLFLNKNNMHKSLDYLYNKYGDICFLKFGSHNALIINSPKLLKELLVDKSDNVRERFIFPTLATFGRDKSIMVCNIEIWRKLRSLIIISFSKSKMGSYDQMHHNQYMKLENHIKKLIKINNIISLERQFMRLTFNVIFSLLFGEELKFDDPMLDSIFESIESLLGSLQKASDMIPFLGYFTNNKDIDLIVDKLIETVNPFIEKVISKHDKNNPKCALDHMINGIIEQQEQQQDGATQSLLTNEFLPYFVIDMYLGASESTPRVMEWFVIAMTKNQDCQNKLFEELKSNENKYPLSSNKSNYPYLNASIKEVLRYRPIVPIVPPRKLVLNQIQIQCENDDKEYVIPVNTMVIPNIYSFNFDTKYHNDPFKFNPNRYLGENQELSHLTFNQGPRVCAFQAFALDELFITFSRLFQSFQFQSPFENKLINDDPIMINSLRPKYNNIKIIERK